MKLVVGLGNPGPEYERTRHNVGFRIADAFCERMRVDADVERFGGRLRTGRLEGDDALAAAVLQPATYMNRSGRSVARAVAELGTTPGLSLSADECLVVYDDLDLDLGRVRLRARGGAGGHNGIGSVIDELGTDAVPRLRFGVSRPPGGSDPAEYVLAPFEESEERELAEALGPAVDAIVSWMRHGIAEAMTLHNRRPVDP